MSIYDHLSALNDTHRPASDSMDRMEAIDRNIRMVAFALGCLAVLSFGLIVAYTFAGWTGL